MKVKRLGALILAGVLTCTAPSVVLADEITEEILMDTAIDSLLSDPDKVADIVIYVKDAIDQQDISDDDIRYVIDQAAENFDVNLSDSDKESLLKIVKKFKDMDLDEEQLRTDIKSVYDKLESLGIEKEDVKGVLGKLIDLAKNILE
ncbi:MAG: DUF1002 domain-containing protein [Eubacteriales bacterium]|nr:DUF1002 domain-containing protein [Eubacteriales bacterium]